MPEGLRARIRNIITSKVRCRLSRGHYSKEHGHYGVYHWSGLDEAVEAIYRLVQDGKLPHTADQLDKS